ncbi:hypothetical protein NOR_07305 [Metarhizium rileyi]|uniref:Uncharacterized protein n=1 Tax=Metarhizium rileyi (strain RCEF 4871) TaxID=1649241 RepID=A0A166YLD5_METRR|nr:hypothetical protein NOR_07305 [Metarhizium rileyi RCEF 4871]
MARLRGLTGPIHIWDTPSPPPLRRSIVDDSIITPTPYPRDVHLGTVELPSCTGITFFVAHGSTYAVHAHTKADLYAYRTFENLPPARRKTVAWIYVPIHGKITEIGFSRSTNQHGLVAPPQHLWFRFESAREVLIGPYNTKPRDFASLRRPQTLIYKKNDKLPICFVGGFSEKDIIGDTAPPKQLRRTPPIW